METTARLFTASGYLLHGAIACAPIPCSHRFFRKPVESLIAENRKYGCIEVMNAIVTMTSRGVLTLPAKLRKAVGLKPEDPIIAETTEEGILLRPAVTLPVEVYSPDRVREFDEAETELSAVLRVKRKR